MNRNINYNFESYKKFDDDLYEILENTSLYERLIIALSYVNRQSDAFEHYLSLDHIFDYNIFQDYIEKAMDVLKGNEKASSFIDVLSDSIPDGDDNISGWPFAFMQNALISLLTFFELVENKGKISLVIDIATIVLNNVDIIWFDNNEGSEEEELEIFGKEVSVLFNLINEISKKKVGLILLMI